MSSLELIHVIDSEGMYRLFMLMFCLLIGMLYPGYGKIISYEWILLIWIGAVFFIVGILNYSTINLKYFQKTGSFAKAIFFPVYVTIPYILLVMIRSGNRGSLWILFILLSAWILDIFSYFTGMLIGKHRIAPKISPKKTVEGLFGGLIFSGFFIYLYLKTFTDVSLFPIIVISLTLPFAGFLGDLFESFIKRSAGIKDSGDLLSGHGGFLDRFDSILFIIILFSFYQRVLLWL
jgi:phosphatidate cytidylyltransferase